MLEVHPHIPYFLWLSQGRQGFSDASYYHTPSFNTLDYCPGLYYFHEIYINLYVPLLLLKLDHRKKEPGTFWVRIFLNLYLNEIQGPLRYLKRIVVTVLRPSFFFFTPGSHRMSLMILTRRTRSHSCVCMTRTITLIYGCPFSFTVSVLVTLVHVYQSVTCLVYQIITLVNVDSFVVIDSTRFYVLTSYYTKGEGREEFLFHSNREKGYKSMVKSLFLLFQFLDDIIW